MNQQQQNIDLVRRLYEDVFNEGETNLIPKIVAEDAVIHTNPSDPPGLPEGPQGLQALVEFYREGFPDARQEIEEIFAHDDLVVVRWTAKGTNTGPFMGLEPTNKSVTVPGIDIVQVEGGLVTEMRSVFDSAGMLLQLGVIEPPGM